MLIHNSLVVTLPSSKCEPYTQQQYSNKQVIFHPPSSCIFVILTPTTPAGTMMLTQKTHYGETNDFHYSPFMTTIIKDPNASLSLQFVCTRCTHGVGSLFVPDVRMA